MITDSFWLDAMGIISCSRSPSPFPMPESHLSSCPNQIDAIDCIYCGLSSTKGSALSGEARLILAFGRIAKLPLPFRRNSESIAGASALKAAALELSAYREGVDFSLLGAGRCYENNAKTLCEEAIQLEIRLIPSSKLYKDLFGCQPCGRTDAVERRRAPLRPTAMLICILKFQNRLS
jgi:hypothetical protein